MSQLLKALLISLLILFSVPAITAAQDAQDESSTTHTVQPGENLFRIALRYGVGMDELAQANNITDQRRIYAGQVLVIPGLTVPDDSPSVSNPLVAGVPVPHTVQRGESLSIIAQRYGVTVDDILQANSIDNPNRIYAGQQLNIWTTQASLADNAPVTQPTEAESIPYTVQPGEHLAQIAARYGIDWPTLAQVNGITNPSMVYAGQQIMIPARNADGGLVDMGIVTNPPGAPIPTVTNGKQIIIDLSDSRVYAFENGILIRSVLVSTGLPATPTVTGNYRIYNRVRSQTMSGPGYSLPNVEWVLYFYQGYALHGAYWHSNWGNPMSHGCVNMPNSEAQWFYENFGEIGLPVLVQQ